MKPIDHVTAGEAAALLGVSRATLYAYVSRGLVRSEPFGNGRQRRYARGDIDRLLRRRQGEAADPAAAEAGSATVLLPSAITLIAEGRLYYRGHDAIALSDAMGLEAAARLLWQCDGFDPFAEEAGPPPSHMAADHAPHCHAPPGQAPLAGIGLQALPPLPRLLASLPGWEAADPQAVNHSRRGCARTGARLLHLALDVLVPVGDSQSGRDGASGQGSARQGAPPEGARPAMHEQLARRWCPASPLPDRTAADLLRRALVLCADHEFNPSTFTARCVAGTGASIYAAVGAALAALQGPRHGGATARIAAFLDGIARPGGPGEAVPADDPAAAIAACLARGEDLPGFGHPLYPEGDPRAASLLRALARARLNDPKRLELAQLVRAAGTLTDLAPNIDFALVALARVLDLPPAAPITIFALARMTGWIAHIEEQYRDGRIVRPRAAYIGLPPG